MSGVPSDNSQSTRPTGGTKRKGLCGDTTHILLEMKIYFYVLKACEGFEGHGELYHLTSKII